MGKLKYYLFVDESGLFETKLDEKSNFKRSPVFVGAYLTKTKPNCLINTFQQKIAQFQKKQP